jgi:hypothetical protein
MDVVRKTASALAILAGMMAASGDCVGADPPLEPIAVTIATGPLGGLYHPVGGALCALLNEGRDTHGITCTVEITSGSVNNIKALRDGDAQLAIIQSDTQQAAFTGGDPFTDSEPFDTLRSVMALYVEQFTVVVGKKSDIETFADLRGHRVYIGPSGSGRRQTAEAVMAAYGFSPNDVIDVADPKASDEAVALCNNEFDAFIMTIGNPNATIKTATATCGARLVPLDGAAIDAIVTETPVYVPSTIPAGMYPNVTTDIQTLGLVATLVTTATERPELAYHVARAFFANADSLRQASAIFTTLADKERVRAGLTAPMHDGAVDHFSETGLIAPTDAEAPR